MLSARGLATLAAAGGPGPDRVGFQPQDVRAAWVDGTRNYAANFREVQQFFLDIVDHKLEGDAIPKRGFEFFGLLGPWYTVGWKMAVTIEEVYGEDVIDAFCDQRHLLQTYNAAAAEHARRRGESLPMWDQRLIDALNPSAAH